jgi:hypothetical protein
MATIFLEPGGDADYGIALYDANAGASTQPVVATDFVHGGHIKSTKYAVNSSSSTGKKAILADAGGRFSFWIYLNALPSATCSIWDDLTTGYNASVFILRMTSAGILQLFNSNGSAQIGSNGATLATGQWYRISIAWVITSSTVNTLKVFVNGASSISTTNNTLANTTGTDALFGNVSGNSTLDLRTSDVYCDNSTALTDPGNIWVTAKRPFANGTTNGFTTQIGAGGSGYGTGHAPQVNERPLSTTNGWSMVGAGSAVTEEYSIEGSTVGDISLAGATLVDFMGWVDVKALVAETGSIILAGVSSSISVTTSASIFITIAGSSSYPAGGTDIGVITSTTVTTFSLYECGVVFAYVPGAVTTLHGSTLSMMGVG